MPVSPLHTDASAQRQQAFAVHVAPNTAANSSATADMTLLDEFTGRALIGEFAYYYGQGDLDQFMQLFSKKADKQSDMQIIAHDYGALFMDTQQRAIYFSDAQWHSSVSGGILHAHYTTRVKGKFALFSRHSEGSIEFTMAMENGRP
jgi:hypothetical protein